MIIDTHSHCYWENLRHDINGLIDRMTDQGVIHAVQIGCDPETTEKAVTLARQYPSTFSATVGLHPETAQDVSPGDLDWMEEYIQKYPNAIVAIGECGLDYHYLDGSDGGQKKIDLENLSDRAKEQIENQKYWWRSQWQLAKKYDLPLVIHSRDARDATLQFMQQEGIDRAVMHCFAEDPEFARSLMEIGDGIYFSFSGILTYKSAPLIQETACMLPLDRILVETDAPFLSPQPVRGRVCEPSYTRYTLNKLIDIRPEPADEIERQVYENSVKFYGLDKKISR